MRILVTGANGMLGVDLCALAESAGHELIRTDIGVREGLHVSAWEHLDTTDTGAVRQALLRFAPEAVIHAAAWTDVDGCERSPDRAFRMNAMSTWNVAASCAEQDCLLAYLSTDFVFDGVTNRPYTEFDTPHPLSHYGASKLAGERFVAQLCRRHFILRTAWLFGPHGRSFPNTILNLARTRTELPVVTDQTGSPTHTMDLARTLLSLLSSPLYGLYHVVNGGSCSWFQLAQKTLELAGITSMQVRPIPSSQYPSPTRRPGYSVLRRFALEMQGKDDLPSWEIALADHIRRLQDLSEL